MIYYYIVINTLGLLKFFSEQNGLLSHKNKWTNTHSSVASKNRGIGYTGNTDPDV